MKPVLKHALCVGLTIAAAPSLAQESALTLEQIMANPDWLGNAPTRSYWGADSASVYYEQKRVGSELSDLYVVDSSTGSTQQVPESEWSSSFHTSISYNATRDRRAYVYSGDIYLVDASGTRQVTRTSVPESDPFFLSDARRVAFTRDEQFYVHDPESGLTEQVTDIRFEDDPDKEEDFDVLQAHQKRLFDEFKKQEQDEEELRQRNKHLFEVDSGLPAAPVYMGKDLDPQDQSLSPSGRWLVVVTEKKDFKAGKEGSMPNYVTASGYTENETLRTRVGRTGRAPQTAWLIDLGSGEKHELDPGELPGIDEDPLADLRKSAIEIYVAEGEDREAAEKRLESPDSRGVQFWALQWSPDGSELALYVRANDNKDRWIATVDFDARKLVNQHRLSDEAWVNPYHIEHGWLADNKTLWFLSEDHGYLGIYTKVLNQRRSKALVAEKHIVVDPVLDPSGQYLYYSANAGHPSIYEVWRVNVQSGESEQMTNMGGMNSFAVSPDASQLLLVHSETNRHDDLFVMENTPGADARRLTDTMSAEYKSIAWIDPAIVAVPSSHVDAPIYSKIYLPEDHDSSKSYPAVMFVHGAGYTQNAHAGWPYYFREGMFHNLLTQHGYVVIDMDFRASEGYGRDWRTAIYRQMGHPELEDLEDGVDYIVENYGVDRERVGVYGGSYGGFMTCIAMFRAPGLFQSGAALRPVTDWAHYNHGYTSNILNTPDVDPEAYRASSPIEFAGGLEGSLLLAAGMQDNNVFFQDTVLLVQRLLELQKEDFEIAIYPLDPHNFERADSWLDEYRRIFKLFETTLK